MQPLYPIQCNESPRDILAADFKSLRGGLPISGGWGYALFNYEAASDTFAADPTGVSDCGHACHVAVKAKDYIFHPYQKR